MEVSMILDIITTVGFPIVCVGAMGWFIYKIYCNMNIQNAENMEKVQERCKEREDKLYEEIRENREVNAKAIETIAHYAEKLDTIQIDISDIKTDIAVMKNR